MKYNLEGKIFRSISNTVNSEVSSDTLFHYHQDGEIISAEYYGGIILKGHLIGKMLETGQLDFIYHHINKNLKLMAGKCLSTPELLPGGTLKFVEQWEWLSGDNSSGQSVIEEIDSV
ncbi:MAG: n-acetylglutamate synthase [Proteobacteria bacterium]|nr:n-acetylglutamate synthase [Pseudomonadota bacterium]